jgi:hypothetical protein
MRIWLNSRSLGRTASRASPLLLALLVCCAGDSPPPSGVCTGAAYEPCLEEHNCNAGLCQNFIAEGFQVCTLACDDTIPCPTGGTCEAGICKPAEPVDCELQP